jgi:hypothetical protein
LAGAGGGKPGMPRDVYSGPKQDMDGVSLQRKKRSGVHAQYPRPNCALGEVGRMPPAGKKRAGSWKEKN